MAIAGRVAMIPKGDYDATVTYQILDVVRYNDASYVAKKSSTGMLPTDAEYWMLMTQDGLLVDDAFSETSERPVQNKVVNEAIQNILNGTTPVEDSKKLNDKEESALSVANADTVDGYHASEFAKSKDFYRGDTFVGMETGNTNELYRLQLQNGTVAVYKSTDSGATWSLLGVLSSNLDLAHYFPLTGGTVAKADSEPLILKNTSADFIALAYWGMSGRLGSIGFSANDILSVWGSSGNHLGDILHTGNSSKVVQATSAPTDTTAVWVDTANKITKIYKDGAWTALA